MTKLIVASVIFVVTSGSLFSEKFRENRALLAAAGVVSLLSAVYLFLAIREDVRTAFELRETVQSGDKVLDGLPSSIPNDETNFPYQIEQSGNQWVFTFPTEAIDLLLLTAPNGDLSGAMLSVMAEDKSEFVCQHFVAFSAPDPSQLGIRVLGDLVNRLDCGVWEARGDGHWYRRPGSVDIQYISSAAILKLVVSGSEANASITESNELRFRLGYPNQHTVLQQSVPLNWSR